MPTINYRLKNGKRVQGVTTVLSVLAKPALIYWGYEQGLENYRRVTERVSELLNDVTIAGITGEDVVAKINKYLSEFQVGGLYEKRDKAGTAGTLAHAFVEHELKGLPEPDLTRVPADVRKKAEGCLLSFLEWRDRTKFKLIYSEVPLVSETHKFGGCIDAGGSAEDGGEVSRLELIDLKSAKDIYWSNWIQLAGYGIVWDENHPEEKITGYNILRIGEDGDFDHKHKESLDDEKEIFLSLNKIHQKMTKRGWKL